MRTQFDLKRFAEKITDNQHNKKDILATTKSMEVVAAERKTFEETKNQTVPAFQMNITNGETGQFPIRDYAHGQISAHTDIPRAYYNRMQRSAPELFTRSVNHWLHENNDARLVRTMHGEMRAFLSNRYQPLENEAICEAIMPILGEIPDVQWESLAVTESRMYIKVVTPRIQAEVELDDVVQAGICIRNSEIGNGALVVEPLIYRLKCKNGMVLPDTSWRKTHIGKALSGTEKIAHLLSDETIRAGSKATLMQIRDVVKAATDAVFFEESVEKMRLAKNDEIVGDIPAAVETFAKQVNLTKEETSGVLDAMIRGNDFTRFGLLNATTRFSQDIEDYDRASDFEVLGGRVLELPRSAWKQIATAKAA